MAENETKAATVIREPSEKQYDALDAVDIIASGYEFDCPKCETYNTLIDIPRYGRAVQCRNCKSTFRVEDAVDAQD
jgi:hypothetical protein